MALDRRHTDTPTTKNTTTGIRTHARTSTSKPESPTVTLTRHASKYVCKYEVINYTRSALSTWMAKKADNTG